MKKLLALLSVSLLASLANAMTLENPMPLDKVVFQLSAKQWVTTQTALLKVSINATLTNADLVKTRAEIMGNLNKIAQGDWQLTQFDRSQDSSGMEKLYVLAQMRVPQAQLTNIYKNAKAVSRPGATYDINAVDFKPSLDEIQQVKASLREKLYHQVNDEVDRLNKVYTTQKYSVNRISFLENEPSMPMARGGYQPQEMNVMALSAAPSAAPPADLSISNEMVLRALVELASNRNEGKAVATQ